MPERVSWWFVNLVTSCSLHTGQGMDKKPGLCTTAGAVLFREGFVLKGPPRRHTICLLCVLKCLISCNHTWLSSWATSSGTLISLPAHNLMQHILVSWGKWNVIRWKDTFSWGGEGVPHFELFLSDILNFEPWTECGDSFWGWGILTVIQQTRNELLISGKESFSDQILFP